MVVTMGQQSGNRALLSVAARTVLINILGKARYRAEISNRGRVDQNWSELDLSALSLRTLAVGSDNNPSRSRLLSNME